MKTKRKNQANGVEYSIYFSAEPETVILDDRTEQVIRLAVGAALQYEKFPAACELSVTVCDGPYIRALNAEYRNKDAETDVLSFPLFDEDEEDPLDEEVTPLGDIVINLDRAAQQAAELGHGTRREIAFLAVHSVLHLLGYDHERSEEDEEDMCRRQKDIITGIEEEIRKIEGQA